MTAASRTILAASIVHFVALGCGEKIMAFLVFNAIKDLKQFKEFDVSTTKKQNVSDITPDDAIRNIIDENNKHLKNIGWE